MSVGVREKRTRWCGRDSTSQLFLPDFFFEFMRWTIVGVMTFELQRPACEEWQAGCTCWVTLDVEEVGFAGGGYQVV